MPWAAGTFSRLYGSAGWVDDRDAGTKILATRHDSHDQDLSDGINACLKKDGTNAATADLNIGGFKLTNLADPTSAQHAATKAYVDAAGSIAFASGDQILFRGAATPTGWTIRIRPGGSLPNALARSRASFQPHHSKRNRPPSKPTRPMRKKR